MIRHQFYAGINDASKEEINMKQVEELRYLILAAQREGSRTFAEILLPLGLTPAQSEVLRVLYEYEPLSLVELGELLVCETGSPSRLVNRLVEAGLVGQQPSEQDSRKVKLTLTQNGQNAVTSITAIEEKVYESISQMVEGAPVQELIDLLWKQVEGKPTGKAIARRKIKKNDDSVK